MSITYDQRGSMYPPRQQRSTIYGELTDDGARVLLIAAGALEDIAMDARRLQLLTPLLQPTNPAGAMQMPLSWPGVVQLTATYGERFQPMPRLQAWIAQESERRLSAGRASELAVGVPEGLTPRPYQIEGAHLIAATGRALITDEPGTGKTITTILGLLERYTVADSAIFEEGPVVVVCPASVVDPWVEAWLRWAPQLVTVAWRGTKRRDLLGAAQVYVTSYDIARMDAQDDTKSRSPLMWLKPAAVVADECHLIKNPKASRTQAVQRLARRTRAFVALSGTPITHHPADLWPTLTCVAPGAWPAGERWVARYCETVPGDYDEEILGLAPAAESEFRLALLGQFRRVAKADVLTQLPPKVYSVRMVELPKEWRRAYDEMESQMLAELPDGQELAVMDILTQLARLSQLASAPADVEIEFRDDPQTGQPKAHYHVTLKGPSWKVDALLEEMEQRPGQQVIAFAPSRQLVMLAGEAATKAGRRVGYVVGGQTARQRTETVDAFQRGELDLICATTGAGGVGLTLTAAKCVVFLQRPWALEASIQAEDRAHRIGSEHHDSIDIVDIVAANTIDSRVRAVLKAKAGQLSDLVQDPRIVAELLGGVSLRDQKAA
ncbi:DEAD/DEAH box helicase [Amycolatopsis cynarae]|uniref:DEAD/DEAH box helicase n=1 Tax=Amycolatopsis cynarae TaxID=2995223 RepID=A0ABY7B761_9PSEU|nr:DEAD/DEAH box helicase [Amycolatopsis sp. HUAS 11-8]WAL67102.1 DEAD/DEAH box helicase [Amycolatopsis sp. HUAS 11-8]